MTLPPTFAAIIIQLETGISSSSSGRLHVKRLENYSVQFSKKYSIKMSKSEWELLNFIHKAIN